MAGEPHGLEDGANEAKARTSVAGWAISACLSPSMTAPLPPAHPCADMSPRSQGMGQGWRGVNPGPHRHRHLKVQALAIGREFQAPPLAWCQAAFNHILMNCK